jgi:hypothetical protein
MGIGEEMRTVSLAFLDELYEEITALRALVRELQAEQPAQENNSVHAVS